MTLIKIGNTIINFDLVTDIDIDPYDQGPPEWRVGINFIGSTDGEYSRVIEGHDAAMLMDWLRRNAKTARGGADYD